MAWPEDGVMWFSYCAKLHEVAMAMFAVSEIIVEDDTLAQPKIFAATLLSRSLQNLHGVVATARAGLVTEAGTLARCCVENSLWMRQLQMGGEKFSKAILEDNTQQITSLVKRIPASILLSFENEDRAFIAQLLSAKRSQRISVGEGNLTEEAERDYLMFKILSGAFAHPSAMSLSRHIGIDATTQRQELLIEPRLTAKDFHGLFLYALLAVLSTMERYSDIVLGISVHEGVAALEIELAGMKERVDATLA